MLVMWVWLFDIGLSSVIGSNRFDLGWYAGRIFGLIASSFLLIMLLVEMARLYAGVMDAAESAEQRLLELLRALSQNIAHYRSILEAGPLDEAQRGAFRKLLAEEEAKLNSKQVDRAATRSAEIPPRATASGPR